MVLSASENLSLGKKYPRKIARPSKGKHVFVDLFDVHAGKVTRYVAYLAPSPIFA